MESFQDDEILKLFVEEAKEHLEAIEGDLLLIEASGEGMDPALVHKIFRAVHSIKGSAGCLGFDTIMALSHELECVFAAVRDGLLIPNPSVISNALMGLDLLFELVNDAYRSNQRDVSQAVEALKATLKPPPEIKLPDLTTFRDGTERLGEILVNEGVVSPIDIDQALSQQRRLGEILLSQGTIDPLQLDQALSQQKKLGEILISQGKVEPTQLDEALSRQKIQSQNSIRMDASKIDALFNLIGEAVIAQSQVLALAKGVSGKESNELRSAIGKLGSHIGSLHREILDARMIPVGPTFSRFQRVVRDLSISLEKKIDFVLVGEDTRLDKTVIERIGDPLMHLVRNAIDHGLEGPAERLASGKNDTGRLTLRAEKKGHQILIKVEDDGHGMDPARLKKKAVEKALLTKEKADSLTDHQALELVFAPGFSTAEKLTDISGRGVGMDVVRTNIQALSGTVEIDSVLGKGSVFTIRLPLNLAISTGLFFEAGGENFILPIDQIEEVVKLPWSMVHDTPEGEFGYQRGELVPIRRIDRLLGLPEKSERGETANLLIVSGNGRKVGFMIDRPLAEQEIVVKPLRESLQSLPGLSGATILGDGRVLLILDSEKLIQLAAARGTK